MADVDVAWASVTGIFRAVFADGVPGKSLDKHVQVLQANGLQELVVTWVLHHLSEKIKSEFVVPFWAPFLQYEALNSASDAVSNVGDLFINAVTTAHAYFTRLLDAVKSLDRCLDSVRSDLCERFSLTFNTLVFNSPPSSFQDALALFFERQFKLAVKGNPHYISAGSDEDEESDSEAKHLTIIPCSELGVLLQELRWTGMIEETVSSMLYGQIEKEVRAACEGQLESPCLDQLNQYLKNVVLSVSGPSTS
jgi:hypothetical protein